MTFMVDPRILVPEQASEVPAEGSLRSSPYEVVRERAVSLFRAGYRTGPIDDTLECFRYTGMEGVRVAPVPDSIVERLRACDGRASVIHLVASPLYEVEGRQVVTVVATPGVTTVLTEGTAREPLRVYDLDVRADELAAPRLRGLRPGGSR